MPDSHGQRRGPGAGYRGWAARLILMTVIIRDDLVTAILDDGELVGSRA